MLRKISPRLGRGSIIDRFNNYIYDFINLAELNFRGGNSPLCLEAEYPR